MNKKGISIMVGYVLLIVIAIGISVLVFNYLKIVINPGESPECDKEVTLILQNYTCTISPERDNLTITLFNKGLFNADGAYIRLGNASRVVKLLVDESPGEVFKSIDYTLAPDQSFTSKNYDVSSITRHTPGKYVLGIEPAVYNSKYKALALCNQYTISQEIICQ